MMIGQQFGPNADNDPRYQQPQSGSPVNLQQAIEILKLRIPRFYGGGFQPPSPLMGAGGAMMPPSGGHYAPLPLPGGGMMPSAQPQGGGGGGFAPLPAPSFGGPQGPGAPGTGTPNVSYIPPTQPPGGTAGPNPSAAAANPGPTNPPLFGRRSASKF